MAVKTVIWTITAVRQRRRILHYWTKRNKSITYSEKLIYEISQRVQLLIKSPEIYISTNIIDVRASTLGDYTIFYKITDKELIIVAFWDNRQNPKKLFNLLKKA